MGKLTVCVKNNRLKKCVLAEGTCVYREIDNGGRCGSETAIASRDSGSE